MDWRARFQNLVREIQHHPLLQLDEVEVPGPAPDAEILTAEGQLGADLPGELLGFYAQLNGFRLAWSLRRPLAFAGEREPAGSIELLPLAAPRRESVFGDWQGVVWSEHDPRFLAVRPFDFFAPECCAALHPAPGQGSVYFHRLEENLCRTGYGFAEYLELLLQSRGYLYWSMSLCAEERDTPAVRAFKVNLPKLFPGQSVYGFRPKPRDERIEALSLGELG